MVINSTGGRLDMEKGIAEDLRKLNREGNSAIIETALIIEPLTPKAEQREGIIVTINGERQEVEI